MTRANPFGDLDDFAPQGKARPVPAAAIDQIAEASGFPSRKAQGKVGGKAQDKSVKAKPRAAKAAKAAPSPAPTPAPAPAPAPLRRRRRTTGRNQQINIKATEETIAELYRVADELDLPLGAVLERALAALISAKS